MGRALFRAGYTVEAYVQDLGRFAVEGGTPRHAAGWPRVLAASTAIRRHAPGGPTIRSSSRLSGPLAAADIAAPAVLSGAGSEVASGTLRRGSGS